MSGKSSVNKALVMGTLTLGSALALLFSAGLV